MEEYKADGSEKKTKGRQENVGKGRGVLEKMISVQTTQTSQAGQISKTNQKKVKLPLAKPTQSTEPTKPNLGSYTDFRKYLEDFYNYKKTLDVGAVRPYSYAIFSVAAGIKSPSYLKLIIDGKRNLSSGMMDKFSKALQLNKSELKEFRALVEYGQAKDSLARNQALKTLAELRVCRQIKKGEINGQTWDKASDWLTWVLYNMVDQRDIFFHPQELQKLLRGRVTVEMVKRAKENLLASGELVCDTNTGKMKKKRLLMEKSEEISVEIVRKLQSEFIYLSLESLFRDQPRDREFGAVTLALTEKEFEKMKFELRQLKKRFFTSMATNREFSKGDRIYQLNIQFFPITDAAPKPTHKI